MTARLGGASRRPFALMFVASTLFIVALSLPLQVMVLCEHALSEWPEVLHKLTLLNWLTLAGCVITGALAYRGSGRTRYAVPTLTAIVALNNFFVGYAGTDYSLTSSSLGTLSFGALVAPLYFGRARDVILNPGRRWWRTKVRYARNIPIFVGGDLTKVNGETFDISESGVFVPLTAVDYPLEGDVSICLTLGAFRQIRCGARVVRRGPAKGSYPAGVGLQFTDLTWRQRRELKNYLARHP